MAGETGAPVAELVRRAIDEFIARRKAAKESTYHGESIQSTKDGSRGGAGGI